MIEKSETFTYENAFTALQEWVEDIFIKEKIEYDDSGKIPLFIQYLNYHSKLVVIKPRKVSLSKNFSVDAENQAGLDDLISKLTNGVDVNSYLSKRSIKAGEVDGMLDNFGIKHFHLGKNTENGFIQRTQEIALAIVTDDEVFFITSKLHGKGFSNIWYEKDVLEILHNERPDLIEHCKIDILVDVSPSISDTEDIKSLRNSNINGAITLNDGTCYLPYNLGQTLSGFGLIYTMTITSLARDICTLVNAICKDNKSIRFLKINKIEINMNGIPQFIEFQFYNDLKKDYEYFKFWKEG